jgi:serine/threonine protein phosphatase PrpC
MDDFFSFHFQSPLYPSSINDTFNPSSTFLGHKRFSLLESSAKAVSEFAVVECIGLKKSKMEDSYLIWDNFLDRPDQAFFLLLDGHGGSSTVEIVKEHFAEIFEELLEQPDRDVGSAIREAFLQTNRLCEEQAAGSTACLVLLRAEEQGQVAYIGNVGDTRAVYRNNDGEILATRDHVARNPFEAKRVEEEGGFVKNDRLWGRLAVTRAFGDFVPASAGLIAEPEIRMEMVDKMDGFIVMATDGVFDKVLNKDVMKMCKPKMSALDIAHKIIYNAVDKNKSRDNSTWIVIKLKKDIVNITKSSWDLYKIPIKRA